MSTYLSTFLDELDKQWKEIDVLLKYASEQRSLDEELYNVLCRSITILIVAHLEGFIKDLAKNAIRDLSQNIDFVSLPNSIKRTYCIKYLGKKDNHESAKSYEKKVQKLIEKFDEANIEIEYEQFTYENNRNPKPSVIENIFENFGIEDIFKYLHSSDLEDSFSSSLKELTKTLKKLRKYTSKHTESFPFSCSLEKYSLSKSSLERNTRTIWETFLDDINHKRHNIVHGNNFENTDDISELEKTKIKVTILQLALINILSNDITKNINSSTL